MHAIRVMMCVCVYVIPILRTILQVGDRLSELPELWVVFDGFGRICSNQSSQKTLSSGWGECSNLHTCVIYYAININICSYSLVLLQI